MNATQGIRASAIAALLTLTPAGGFAADVGARSAPAAVPVAPIPYYNNYYNWTGFYIGGNVGGAWESITLSDDVFPVGFSSSRSGFIAGGQIGYNWQISPLFVVGVEWMFDGTDISSTDSAIVGGSLLTATAKVDWITTIAARFGVAMNNWLFYGKAGGGWVHETVTLADLTAGVSVSDSNTNGGWLIGAGIEYGLTPNWTIRVEFDHIGLNSMTNPGFVTLSAPDVFTVSRDFDMVTLGMNYRF
jgi:outer membrane immunogenic protein